MRTPRAYKSLVITYRRDSNKRIVTLSTEAKRGNSLLPVLKTVDIRMCARDCAVYKELNRTDLF